MDTKRNSKYLSYILRHRPDEAGIILDENGWTDVGLLLAACATHGHPMTRDELQVVVDTNDKKRFAISEDGLRIRASQGHSIDLDLGYKPCEPPEYLWHGTARKTQDPIKHKGLLTMNRTHVHLSIDESTARKVGERHGSPLTIRVEAKKMHYDGFKFFLSDNGVWLTDHVPPKYLVFPFRGGK